MTERLQAFLQGVEGPLLAESNKLLTETFEVTESENWLDSFEQISAKDKWIVCRLPSSIADPILNSRP